MKDRQVAFEEGRVFAQSLVEYGAIASIGSAVQTLVYSVEAWIDDAGAMTWIIVGVAVLVGLKVLSRRGS